jgi:hypothetical protein
MKQNYIPLEIYIGYGSHILLTINFVNKIWGMIFVACFDDILGMNFVAYTSHFLTKLMIKISLEAHIFEI